MMFSAPVIIFVGLLQYAASDCPDGWTSHGSQCYHFSHDEEPWGNAEQMCELLGGHLLEIESAAENAYIQSQVRLYGNKFEPFIALADLAVENEFVWMISDVKLADTGYSNWGRGQPNNIGNENCVEFKQDGTWNDDNCDESHFYVCEKPDEGGVNVFG